jgi:hypothetical protein
MSFRNLLSFGKSKNHEAYADIQITGDLPELDLTTGTSSTGKTCSAAPELLEVNAGKH